MPRNSNRCNVTQSRRRFLISGGVATGSIVGLAGCISDDNGNGGNGDGNDSNGNGGNGSGNGGNGSGNNSDGSNSSGNEDAPRFRLGDDDARSPAPQRHFNPWNPTESGTWHPGEAVFDRIAVYTPASGEVHPIIANDWEMEEDDQLAVEIREDYQWHNGDQFTVNDYITQTQIDIEILRAQNPEAEHPHPIIESMEAVDDFFMRITLQDPVAEIHALRNTIGTEDPARGVFTKHDEEPWSSWLSQLQDAGEDERDEILSEITTTGEPSITEGIGNGPFQVADVGDNEIILEKFEDHPNADNLEFSEMSIHPVLDSDPFVMYTSGEVDGVATNIFPVPEDRQSQLPDGHALTREERLGNYLITFNCGNYDVAADTPFNSRAVRQAVAHVYDRSHAESLLQGDIFTFEYPPSRAPHTALEDGEWDVDDFTMYGQNDTERATELLESEDYERVDGTWMTPDGEPFNIEIMGGEQDPYIQSFTNVLGDFGIETTTETVDDATFDERRNQGDFHIMPDASGADSIIDMWSPETIDLILGDSRTQFGFEMTYPMPIGDSDGESGEKTVNVNEQLAEWRRTDDDEIMRELMWGWNQNIPQFEVMYFPAAGALNHGWELNIPDDLRNGAPDAEYLGLKMEPGLEYTG